MLSARFEECRSCVTDVILFWHRHHDESNVSNTGFYSYLQYQGAHRSTEVPRIDWRTLERLHLEQDAETCRRILPLLRLPQFLHSVATQRGDTLIMDQQVPHCGSKNDNAGEPRVVLCIIHGYGI
jgi:hypothetical protein